MRHLTPKPGADFNHRTSHQHRSKDLHLDNARDVLSNAIPTGVNLHICHAAGGSGGQDPADIAVQQQALHDVPCDRAGVR